MIKKKYYIIIFLFCIFLVSCGEENIEVNSNEVIVNQEKTNLDSLEKDNIRVPISYVYTKNPLLAKDQSLYYFNKLIYEGLYTYNSKLELEPLLTDSLTISEDGRNVVLKLKNGIKWHNGANLSADDVVFTYNFMKYEYQNTIYKDLFETIFDSNKNIGSRFSVQKLDNSTVKIVLDKSYSQIKSIFTIPILNKKTTLNGKSNQKSSYDKISDINYEFKVNGTGPYMYDEYVTLKEYRLKSNEHYWKSKPNIEKVVGIVVSTKEAALTTILSGITDIARVESLDWGKYIENNSLKIYEYADTILDFIVYNHNKNIFKNDNGRLLKSAIGNSFDRSEIVKKSFLNHGQETASLIHPIKDSSIKNILGAQIDDLEFNNYMKELGYSEKNEMGYYSKNGKEFTLSLIAYGDKNRLKEIKIIEEGLMKIGIKLNFKLETDWTEFEKNLKNMNFDMAILTARIPLNSNYYEIVGLSGPLNFGKYNNSELEKIFRNWIESFPTNEISNKNLFLDLIMSDQIVTPIAYRNSAILLNKEIEGIISPTKFNIFYDVEDWTIKND